MHVWCYRQRSRGRYRSLCSSTSSVILRRVGTAHHQSDGQRHHRHRGRAQGEWPLCHHCHHHERRDRHRQQLRNQCQAPAHHHLLGITACLFITSNKQPKGDDSSPDARQHLRFIVARFLFTSNKQPKGDRILMSVSSTLLLQLLNNPAVLTALLDAGGGADHCSQRQASEAGRGHASYLREQFTRYRIRSGATYVETFAQIFDLPLTFFDILHELDTAGDAGPSGEVRHRRGYQSMRTACTLPRLFMEDTFFQISKARYLTNSGRLPTSNGYACMRVWVTCF